MKKIFYYILPLLAAAACSKEQTEVAPKVDEGVFSVVAQTPDSPEEKTTIAPEGSDYKIYWQNGDKISAGSNNISNALSDVTPTSEVSFTFSKAVTSGAFVRCPGVADPTVVVIPAEQTSIGGQYDVDANPMWGTVSVSGTSVPQGKVTLNNAMAMLKFSLTGSEALSKVVIEAVGGEKINGSFAMNTSGVISGGSNTSSKTTISFKSPLALESDPVDLYIPVRPQTYSQGFKMTMHQGDGKFMQVTFFKTGKTLTSSNLAYFSVAYAATREPVDINPLGVLGAEASSYQDDKPANGIRVGSYNVWSDKDRTEKIGDREDQYKYRTWSYARDAVGALIASMDCDVMGFNEITSNTCVTTGNVSLQTAISQYTSDYTYSLRWPNAIDETWWGKQTADYTYANGFIYKSSVVTLNSSGKFWLNSSGSTSDDSDSGGKRTCVWAKFTQKSTSKVFYLAVTHLSIKDQGADDGAAAGEWNLKTAKYLITYLKTRTGATNSDRIILVGDMNASNTSTCQGFKYIVNTISDDPNTNLPFTDARDYLADQDKLSSSEKGLPGTSVGTWNMGQYIKSENHRYDHIMFRNVTVSNYKSYKKTFYVSGDATNTPWYPSDHLPLSVDVVL